VNDGGISLRCLDHEPLGERGDALAVWAEQTGRRRAAGHERGLLRFVFYGRVSTEDHQDPVTSRARQREQAAALMAGHGQIVAEFFDMGKAARWRGRGARRLPLWSRTWRTRTAAGTRS
jgi:hypothetical protein